MCFLQLLCSRNFCYRITIIFLNDCQTKYSKSNVTSDSSSKSTVFPTTLFLRFLRARNFSKISQRRRTQLSPTRSFHFVAFFKFFLLNIVHPNGCFFFEVSSVRRVWRATARTSKLGRRSAGARRRSHEMCIGMHAEEAAGRHRGTFGESNHSHSSSTKFGPRLFFALAPSLLPRPASGRGLPSAGYKGLRCTFPGVTEPSGIAEAEMYPLIAVSQTIPTKS